MKKVIIIAEAGVNHNGDINIAKKLIDVAAEAGVDYVKFKSFKADKLVSPDAKKADYKTYLGSNYIRIPDIFGVELPKYLKYKEKHLTTVIDQGDCASCYSITVAHMLADRISVMTGGKVLRPLSTQELISCWNVKGNLGCTQGGIPETAMVHISKKGIATKADYEYSKRIQLRYSSVRELN